MKHSWRNVARTLDVQGDDVEGILSSDNEEYALYNFVFLCREAFAHDIDRKDWSPPEHILAFIASCLTHEFSSDTEDVSVAAGVGFAEHLFDDAEPEAYGRIHRRVGADFYQLCRPWLRKWLDAGEFELVEQAAK